MKVSRTILTAALATVAFAVLGACTADRSPTVAVLEAPAAQELLGLPLLGGSALHRCQNAGYGTATQVIGPAGGVLKIGPHSLVVPKYALSANTTITATAPAGDYLRVDFAPAGLKFQKSAVLTLNYRDCARWPLLPQIAYVDGTNLIKSLLQPVTTLLTGTVTGKLDHFSGYVLAEGRLSRS